MNRESSSRKTDMSGWWRQSAGWQSRSGSIALPDAAKQRLETVLPESRKSMGCARNPKYACGWLLLAGLFPCRAADVVLLESRQAYAAEEQQIRGLADFYGLQLRTVEVSSRNSAAQAIALVRSPETVAVLASPDSLTGIDGKQIQSARQRQSGKAVPIFVFAIAGNQGAEQLQFW